MEIGWSLFFSLSLSTSLCLCDRETERTCGCVSDNLRVREGVGILCKRGCWLFIYKTKLKIVCAVHVVSLCECVQVCQPCFKTVIREYYENVFKMGHDGITAISSKGDHKITTQMFSNTLKNQHASTFEPVYTKRTQKGKT